MMGLKKIIVFILFVASLYVFAQDDQDLDEVFDFAEEAPLYLDPSPPQVPKPLELLPQECRCQCLTKGTTPLNQKSWRGKVINGKCVCACAN